MLEVAEFFRVHYRSVVSYVMVHGADPHAAEDAAQAAMELLMTRFCEIRNRPGWVRRVARNHFLTAVQRRAQERAKALQGGHLADRSFDTHGVSRDSEEGRRVLALLADLPASQRQVIELVIDGLAMDEIAEVLGKPAVTVRSNLRYARDKLRARLDPSVPHERASAEGE